jgi:cysteine-rich repeat protein
MSRQPTIVCSSLALILVGCNGPGNEGEGGVPVCGDGIQSPDEACDDGNRLGGDGCSPECVPSGTHLECVSILEGDETNEAHALLPMPDQTFVVAGEEFVGNGTRGWIGRFRESGERLWFEHIMHSEGYGRVLDLAPDGQNGSWALVQNGVKDELMHFGIDGVENQAIDIGLAFGISPIARRIEIVDGSLWIGGMVQEDLWLGRYDIGSGQATTVLLEDHLGFHDEIWALARNETEVVIAATVSTSPNHDGDFNITATTDIVFVRFDLQGNELGRSVWGAEPDSQFARIAEDVVTDGQGGWFIGGDQLPLDMTKPAQSWMGRVEPEPRWSWTSEPVAGSTAGGDFGGLVATEEGVILATTVSHKDPAWSGGGGWVTKFDPSGEIQWQWQEANGSEGYERYEEQAIAMGFDGRLRVVGKAWTEDASSLIRSCTIAW